MIFKLILCCAVLAPVQDPDEIDIKAPADWRGETIELPPQFAPDMKMRGVEQLQFAPGMFDAESDSYFSYVFVLRVDESTDLSNEFLQSELKTYYDGLAVSVASSSDIEIEKDYSTVKLSEPKETETGSDIRRLDGEIKWMEMFVSKESQELNLEISIMPRKDLKRIDVFVCASPKDKDQEIWKTMRKIRDEFLGN